MAIHLEQLPHQEAAITKVLEAMKDCIDFDTDNLDAGYVYANPVMKRMRGIDVKMETGTGKTYVYTRLMHELYERFGINKFIIMTPSLAIKEGTKNFIRSEYATQHFRELFPSQKINLGVVNAGDFTTKKGKRKQFAGALTEFCEASRNDLGSVNVLLLNDAMLGSKSMTRNDYDQTLIGSSSCPVEALRLTRPIVIIDEPHRFRKDGTAWANIAELNPQLVVRFGATFPDRVIGSGRDRRVKKDYDNLVYDLTAVDSFNQGLVKAINVQYPNLPSDQASIQYRVVNATNKELVLSRDGHEWTVRVGDDLSSVDPMFEGDTTYEGKKLSNELEVAPGMTLVPGIWTNSYQEMILRQAIDAHFAKERELFNRPMNAPRIKTISLFFIDSIASYRDADGWLKKTFEKLLNEKLTALMARETGEYKKYLEATKRSLNSETQSVHAGYFAEDSGKKGDEAIQAEVDDILRNKEAMLQFKDESGNWNTRRFLFSKWTLREGWDNPNVFVLTKLRSSGSENSKIQEVGRGLRLPVDELGNRISTEEFRLDFLIDYSERDFAEKLVSEINKDGGELMTLTGPILTQLAQRHYGGDEKQAFIELMQQEIVDMDKTVLDADRLAELLPADAIAILKKGKVTTNRAETPQVHLRKHNWAQVRDLWNETSKRFMLQYDDIPVDETQALADAATQEKCFQQARGSVTRYSIEFSEELNKIVLTTSTVPVDQDYGQLPYKTFVKRLHEATNLPINMLHRGMVSSIGSKENADNLFNEHSLKNCIEVWRERFISLYLQKYEYDPLEFNAAVSLYDESGEAVDSINQNTVGVYTANDVAIPANYLYDEAVYDSDTEHDILKLAPTEEVIVFGKIPRRSVRVPTFTGGTSSPDFMYALRNRSDGTTKLYALIEAKGKQESALTLDEKVALEAQGKISHQLKNVNISLVKEAAKVQDILRELSS